MQVVWKFPIDRKTLQAVQMPKGASILSVGDQSGQLMLWAMVDPSNDIESQVIEIAGTGLELIDRPHREFIGTVFQWPYVWHVFKIPSTDISF